MQPCFASVSPVATARRLFLTALLGAGAVIASAQTSAPADTASVATRPPEETIELSPFTVNASEDRGYQAQSSLSGSRLKTDLKDMASPVSVFTEQFLLDTAITSTEDLAKYMISTEYDFGEDAGGQNRLFGSAKPLRMRGLGGGEVTTNFFTNGGNTDTFSTERIEQARGPNAILFGVGSPGGIINTTSKRAKLNANSGSVAAQVRSYDGYRTEGDYNVVVVPNKVAIRLAAVKTELGGWRNNTYSDADRYFGTVKWKLAEKTEVNAELEHGNIARHGNRTFTALDGYTVWTGAGSPLSAVANAAQGTERNAAATATWLVFTENDGTLMNKSAQTRTAARNANDPVLTDFDRVPREVSILGPGMGQTGDYTRLSAFLTHAFTPNLNVEFAARRLDDSTLNVDAQQNFSQYIRFDPSPTLPTGAANPYAGQAYVETQTQRNYRDTRLDAFRTSGSYKFDLGRIFGSHTIAGVGEYNYDKVSALQLREFVVSANAPSIASADNANNRIWRRTYFDINGSPSNFLTADWRVKSSSNLTDPIAGRTYQTDWLPFQANAIFDNATETKTFIGMIQSDFWEKRINTVFGMSRENRTNYNSTGVRSTQAGFTSGPFVAIKDQVGFDSSATNLSFSGVYHATKWLGLTYSRAKNSGLPLSSGAIPSPDGSKAGVLPPRAEGKSQDMGVKLDLLDRKIFISALYFQTSADNDFDFTSSVSQAQMNSLWNALAANGVPNPDGTPIVTGSILNTGSTFSSRTQGYEVDMTANFTKNWRFFFNYTRTKTARSNIAPEMVNYIEFNRAYWTQGDRARMYLVGRGTGLAPAARDGNATVDTIQEQIDLIDANLFNAVVLANGRRPLGQIPQRFNLRTSYDFDSGRLKGFSAGLGIRWGSAPVIRYVAPAAAGSPSTLVLGDEQTFTDINVSYRRKFRAFGHNVNWTIQLNVDNVFDNDKFVILRQNAAGDLLNYKFNDPREWVLTNRFAF